MSAPMHDEAGRPLTWVRRDKKTWLVVCGCGHLETGWPTFWSARAIADAHNAKHP